MENSIKKLQPLHTAVQSFYDKATVETSNGLITLKSYNVKVCEIKNKKLMFLERGLSKTTDRHIKEFIIQNDFEI